MVKLDGVPWPVLPSSGFARPPLDDTEADLEKDMMKSL